VPMQHLGRCPEKTRFLQLVLASTAVICLRVGAVRTIRHMIPSHAPPEQIFLPSVRGAVSRDSGRQVSAKIFPQCCQARILQPWYGLRSVPAPDRCAPGSLVANGDEWKGTKCYSIWANKKEGHTLLRFSPADWRTEMDYFVSWTTLSPRAWPIDR
jgi:hypothetical protein